MDADAHRWENTEGKILTANGRESQMTDFDAGKPRTARRLDQARRGLSSPKSLNLERRTSNGGRKSRTSGRGSVWDAVERVPTVANTDDSTQVVDFPHNRSVAFDLAAGFWAGDFCFSFGAGDL
jgi:hypothetical protein